MWKFTKDNLVVVILVIGTIAGATTAYYYREKDNKQVKGYYHLCVQKWDNPSKGVQSECLDWAREQVDMDRRLENLK